MIAPPLRSPCWIVSGMLLVIQLSFLIVFSGAPAYAQPARNIVTWPGNTPEWDRMLGLGAIRTGCSTTPEKCMVSVDHYVRRHKVGKVFLAIPLDKDRTLEEAREYAKLSLAHPYIYEISFDDWVSQSLHQKMDRAALSNLLTGIVRQLKTVNPKLKFGITLYMDQLYFKVFPIFDLSEDFRNNVDYVHFFPHFRREELSFADAVQRAQKMFPSAQIIPSVYTYDRRDYLPCTRGGARCSNEDEIAGFQRSLKESLDMLDSGKAPWIEFFPGYFGAEEKWYAWEKPQICREQRRQECIANTKTMREIVRQALKK